MLSCPRHFSAKTVKGVKVSSLDGLDDRSVHNMNEYFIRIICTHVPTSAAPTLNTAQQQAYDAVPVCAYDMHISPTSTTVWYGGTHPVEVRPLNSTGLPCQPDG